VSDEPKQELAQVIAVEQRGQERAFVALDDLERLAAEDAASLPKTVSLLRRVYENWTDRTGGVYVNKSHA
jgi:hypothetical protein